jgi:glycosyltransferase involved in cell wall biosynthesis
VPPFLSVVIPAYNEEARLPDSIRTVEAFLGAQSYTSELIVVDDGSRDGTAAVVERATAQWPGLHLLRNQGNRGKGYSVRRGMLEARGDWVLFSDADLSAPIEEASRLLARAGEDYDIVIGARTQADLIGTHQPVLRELSGKFFNLVMRFATGLPYHDTQCGFKLFRREAAQAIFRQQRMEGFSFDVEALYLANRLGFRATDLAVRWNNVEGTKVGMLNGVRAFIDLWRIRWWEITGVYQLGPFHPGSPEQPTHRSK